MARRPAEDTNEMAGSFPVMVLKWSDPHVAEWVRSVLSDERALARGDKELEVPMAILQLLCELSSAERSSRQQRLLLDAVGSAQRICVRGSPSELTGNSIPIDLEVFHRVVLLQLVQVHIGVIRNGYCVSTLVLSDCTWDDMWGFEDACIASSSACCPGGSGRAAACQDGGQPFACLRTLRLTRTAYKPLFAAMFAPTLRRVELTHQSSSVGRCGWAHPPPQTVVIYGESVQPWLALSHVVLHALDVPVLRELDMTWAKLQNLISLAVTGCHVQSLRALAALEHCPSLRAVDLRDNALQCVAGIEVLMPCVRFLKLSSNRLRSLTGLEGLRCLVELDVQDNHLRSWSDLLFFSKACSRKLSVLQLRSNPLLSYVRRYSDVEPLIAAVFGRSRWLVVDGAHCRRFSTARSALVLRQYEQLFRTDDAPPMSLEISTAGHRTPSWTRASAIKETLGNEISSWGYVTAAPMVVGMANASFVSSAASAEQHLENSGMPRQVIATRLPLRRAGGSGASHSKQLVRRRRRASFGSSASVSTTKTTASRQGCTSGHLAVAASATVKEATVGDCASTAVEHSVSKAEWRRQPRRPPRGINGSSPFALSLPELALQPRGASTDSRDIARTLVFTDSAVDEGVQRTRGPGAQEVKSVPSKAPGNLAAEPEHQSQPDGHDASGSASVWDAGSRVIPSAATDQAGGYGTAQHDAYSDWDASQLEGRVPKLLQQFLTSLRRRCCAVLAAEARALSHAAVVFSIAPVSAKGAAATWAGPTGTSMEGSSGDLFHGASVAASSCRPPRLHPSAVEVRITRISSDTSEHVRVRVVQLVGALGERSIVVEACHGSLQNAVTGTFNAHWDVVEGFPVALPSLNEALAAATGGGGTPVSKSDSYWSKLYQPLVLATAGIGGRTAVPTPPKAPPSQCGTSSRDLLACFTVEKSLCETLLGSLRQQITLCQSRLCQLRTISVWPLCLDEATIKTEADRCVPVRPTMRTLTERLRQNVKEPIERQRMGCDTLLSQESELRVTLVSEIFPELAQHVIFAISYANVLLEDLPVDADDSEVAALLVVTSQTLFVLRDRNVRGLARTTEEAFTQWEKIDIFSIEKVRVPFHMQWLAVGRFTFHLRDIGSALALLEGIMKAMGWGMNCFGAEMEDVLGSFPTLPVDLVESPYTLTSPAPLIFSCSAYFRLSSLLSGLHAPATSSPDHGPLKRLWKRKRRSQEDHVHIASRLPSADEAAHPLRQLGERMVPVIILIASGMIYLFHESIDGSWVSGTLVAKVPLASVVAFAAAGVGVHPLVFALVVQDPAAEARAQQWLFAAQHPNTIEFVYEEIQQKTGGAAATIDLTEEAFKANTPPTLAVR